MTIKRSLIGLLLGSVVVLAALEAAWLLLSDAVLLGFIQPRLESAIGARIS